MTCRVRLEKGICGKPREGDVQVNLVPSNFVYYVKEIEMQTVPMCHDHLQLINEGWKLNGTLIFRWVPPT